MYKQFNICVNLLYDGKRKKPSYSRRTSMLLMRRLRLSRCFIMAASGGSRHVDYSYHE